MLISVPDPHPGRCLNARFGVGRCLEYNDHNSKYRFADVDPDKELWNQADSCGWSMTRKPVPWVVPVETP